MPCPTAQSFGGSNLQMQGKAGAQPRDRRHARWRPKPRTSSVIVPRFLSSSCMVPPAFCAAATTGSSDKCAHSSPIIFLNGPFFSLSLLLLLQVPTFAILRDMPPWECAMPPKLTSSSALTWLEIVCGCSCSLKSLVQNQQLDCCLNSHLPIAVPVLPIYQPGLRF
jgi:hypothetical protein